MAMRDKKFINKSVGWFLAQLRRWVGFMDGFIGVPICFAVFIIGSGCASSVTAGSGKDASVITDGEIDGEVIPGTIPVGKRCTSSEDCESGLCLAVGSELLCSVECGECPDETFCTRVDPQTAPAGEEPAPGGFYCLPDRGGLCKPCESDVNCTYPSDRCLDLGEGENVCGRNCAYDGTCPEGYECLEEQCTPLGGTCGCTEEKIGQTRDCYISNMHGTCSGQETCTTTGWDGCDARTPMQEICNGIDDNCDGVLPEEEKDNSGSGTIDCLDDCIPEQEVCDGQDNNCDGIIDNGDPVEMCGDLPNATPACIEGECVLGECDPGYANIDGDMTTGCEVALGDTGGPTCEEAEDLGSLDDSGQTLILSAVLDEETDAWYQVRAVDLPVSESSLCNNFHFRVVFLVNPDDAYKMEIIADNCGNTLECPLPVTDFQWYKNFRQGQNEAAIGECPCMNDPTIDGEGHNECTDHTETYFIKVFKITGSPMNTTPYELEISNGVYSP